VTRLKDMIEMNNRATVKDTVEIKIMIESERYGRKKEVKNKANKTIVSTDGSQTEY
jgi:hypothetical protein